MTLNSYKVKKDLWYCTNSIPQIFHFAQNKLHKASINCKHLSKPKSVFYLVRFSARVQKIKNKKINPTLKKIIIFFQKIVFFIHQGMQLSSPKIKKLIIFQEPILKAQKVIKAALKNLLHYSKKIICYSSGRTTVFP